MIVISYKNTQYGPCLVVPTSTEPHDDTDPWACKLSTRIEGVRSWALCNMLATVSPSRFSQFRGKIPLLPETDFNDVLARVIKWLPRPFAIEN